MEYGSFRPTEFDLAGLGLPERQDWLVCPVSQTRDSGPLEHANFDACLETLGGESETVEVHRFGHWGPGWYEIILVDPSREKEVNDIAEALENYPVLDEEKLSELESEDEEETWRWSGRSDFIREIERRFDVELDDDDDDAIDKLWHKAMEDSGNYPEHTSEGCHLPIDDVVASLCLDDILPLVQGFCGLCDEMYAIACHDGFSAAWTATETADIDDTERELRFQALQHLA